MDLSQLSINKQHKLTQLLLKLPSLFPAKSSPLGQTSVAAHSIQTMGPPIHQPLRRVPESLKTTVANEVDCILDHDVIRPSTSPCMVFSCCYGSQT